MPDFSYDYQVSYGDGSCRISFCCFDTPNSVTLHGVTVPDPQVESLLVKIVRLCLEYHFLWSFSLADSDIAHLNSGETRVKVDARTAKLIVAMQAFHEVEPAFDFTIGPLSFLWKRAAKVPVQQEIDAALRLVGAEKVKVDGCVVTKAHPDMKIDVGGAAKGFVADEIAALLHAQGVVSADIDLGGNLFMVGNHPSGRPWRVSVRIPEGVSAESTIVEVQDASVVTSGSYERFVEIDGVRYQHIVDPRTGWPSASDVVSATVVSPSSLQADMLATTALLLGSEAAPALRDRHPESDFIVLAK